MGWSQASCVVRDSDLVISGFRAAGWRCWGLV